MVVGQGKFLPVQIVQVMSITRKEIKPPVIVSSVIRVKESGLKLRYGLLTDQIIPCSVSITVCLYFQSCSYLNTHKHCPWVRDSQFCSERSTQILDQDNSGLRKTNMKHDPTHSCWLAWSVEGLHFCTYCQWRHRTYVISYHGWLTGWRVTTSNYRKIGRCVWMNLVSPSSHWRDLNS